MRRMIITAAAFAVGAAPALAQQTVEVGFGENLSEAELNAGFFDDAGVSFTLGPGTTFDINDGGSIGQVGEVGSIVSSFSFSGSTVNVNDGGQFVSSFDVASNVSDLTLNVRGGTVGDSFHANFGSEVTISGGTVGDSFDASSGSEVTIAGGAVGEEFKAGGGSTVNLIVTDISIDGTDPGLTPGETIEIAQRGGALLEATLAEGSFFDLQLNSDFSSGQDLVQSGAMLTVTLVEEPGPCNPADIAQPFGLLDGADVNAFITAFGGGDSSADLNEDGVVDGADVNGFITAFGAGCP